MSKLNIEYKNEPEKNRITAYYEGVEIGEVTYSRAGENIFIVDHTFVDDNYRGNKIANQLIKHVVDYAKAEDKKIIPLCPFARKEFDRNPEYQEIESK